ncbi:MAG: hypothetical protein ACI9G9_001035 [Psychromonas sp.]|jgi:hypothetical protein
MKKFKSSILSLLAMTLFIGNSYSQTLNQPANWPNASWSLEGAYTEAGLRYNPTLVANFGFDDDRAGLASVDNIFASSPVIDLTPAFNDGEVTLEIKASVIFASFSSADQLQVGYFNADLAQWVLVTINPPTPLGDIAAAQTCNSKIPFAAATIDISGFTATQLSGFKYRFYYTDNGGWEQAFCISDASITSKAPCPKPSQLTATGFTDDSADLGWNENGTATTWDIELLDAGTPATGTATNAGVTNPFTATGLTVATSYDYYVRANCGVGSNSAWAGPFTFTTTGGTTTCNDPSAGTSSNETNTTAQLAWTENGTANSYNLEIVIKDATATGTPTDVGENPFTATDLTAATTYDYYVQADCSSSLTSEWVGPFTFTTTSTTPTCDAPSNIGTNSISDNQVDIKWTENGTATTWEIDVVLSGDPQGATPSDPGVTAKPYLKTGLVTNTVYDVYIRADCGGTFSAWVGPFTFITTNNGCDAPSDLTATNITADEADLGWTENGTAIAWDIEVVNAGNTATGTANFPNIDSNPYTVNTLAFSTDYEFYVRSSCGADNSSWAGPFAFTTDGNGVCFAPSDLTATNIGDRDAGLAWTENGTSTNWDIEVLPSGTPATGTPTTASVTTNPYQVMGLTPGTGYDYYVRAICTSDKSFWVGPYAFNSTTGIEELNASIEALIFPNPNQGEFTLELSGTQIENLEILVVDLNGKVVFRDISNPVSSEVSKSINLENISKGLYQVVIKTDKGSIHKKVSIK